MQEKQTDVTKELNYAAFIGLDWSDKKHDVYLHVCATGEEESKVIASTPEALDEWILQLRERFESRPVAICLEQARGVLVYMLMAHDFITLYPINPAMSAKYRQAFTPSHAKDDPTDARIMMELLLHHRDRLSAWKPDNVQTRTLARLCEERRAAVNLRTKLVQKLNAKLKMYYPQALTLVGENLSSTLACDFLQKWPSLAEVKKAKPAKVRAFYYGHNCRSESLIQERIKLATTAKAATTDEAILIPLVASVKMLARLIRDLDPAIKDFDEQIKVLFAQHPDAAIFGNLPGAGDALAPRLLVSFGSDRDRYSSAAEVQQFSGIAPVTERSGQRQWVHRRWQCSKFTLQSFHEFAQHSMGWSVWAKAYYQFYKSKGKKHNTIVRSLAFKWIRIIFACWKEHRPYDEARYLETLQRRGSPLCQHLGLPALVA